MKIISSEQKDLIKNNIFLNNKLDESVLEKDFLLTDAIKIISEQNTNPYIDLVFCGGTTLSKCYKIIQRMSEDVDFKMVFNHNKYLQDTGKEISKNKLKKYFSDIKNNIVTALLNAGFDLVDKKADILKKYNLTEISKEIQEQYKISNSDIENPHSKNMNQYISIDLNLDSVFSLNKALRNYIQIELTANQTQLEPTLQPLQNIVSTKDGNTVTQVRCIDLRECVAEKIVSFLRRTAYYINKPEYIDDRLCRHIYDLYFIIKNKPELKNDETIFNLVANIIKKDAIQFKNQFPSFYVYPQKNLQQSLNDFSENNSFIDKYKYFINDLVYGENPGFELCKNNFIELATNYCQLDKLLPTYELNIKFSKENTSFDKLDNTEILINDEFLIQGIKENPYNLFFVPPHKFNENLVKLACQIDYGFFNELDKLKEIYYYKNFFNNENFYKELIDKIIIPNRNDEIKNKINQLPPDVKINNNFFFS